MASFQSPVGNTSCSIPGLGTVKGLHFPDDVHQFCGIKYATIKKRWTKSTLNTRWPDQWHDGTRLGCSAPNPPEYNGRDILLPLEPVPHHGVPQEDELNCLVMNITTPTVAQDAQLPVMVYIHGGSFLYGGANKSIFDGVNFVRNAKSRDTPVVAVNFNYRVGLGGFLASRAIQKDLEKDGHTGCGNFGLYDQQVALHWVNRYIGAFGGDPTNVTIYGESAGGMSVSHQVAARNPAPFCRAIAMSGHLNTIPTWSIDRHDRHYRALLQYLKIDPEASDSLDQLRNVPEKDVAAATLHVEGLFVATGNPCDDGVFHATPPSFDALTSPPDFLKGYMVGDVLDEAMIFSESFAEDSVESLTNALSTSLGAEASGRILNLYGITPGMATDKFQQCLADLAGDTTFRAHNWVAAHCSKVPQTFAYHFDQVSTYDNVLKGLAYHALDLLYLFLNFDHHFTSAQQKLARQMAAHFLDFAYGRNPWPCIKEKSQWMRYGPDDKCAVVTETEDEPIRKYSRTKAIIDMGIYQSLIDVVDNMAVKRHRMGTFEWTPPALTDESAQANSDAGVGKTEIKGHATSTHVSEVTA